MVLFSQVKVNRIYAVYGGLMDIGRILKYYRSLYKLTQSEVAELSGINEKYLGRIERDESVPTIDKVEQLCMAFDIRMSDMLMVKPGKAYSASENSDGNNETLTPTTVYYCNCCGCTFKPNDSEIEKNDIHCPECGCLYDEENGFIEKNVYRDCVKSFV